MPLGLGSHTCGKKEDPLKGGGGGVFWQLSDAGEDVARPPPLCGERGKYYRKSAKENEHQHLVPERKRRRHSSSR